MRSIQFVNLGLQSTPTHVRSLTGCEYRILKARGSCLGIATAALATEFLHPVDGAYQL